MDLKTVDLSTLYKYLNWPANKERFEKLKEFMKNEIVPLINVKKPKILDVMAGTGIAGAALLEALGDGELTLLDERTNDFDKVKEFTDKRVRFVKGDVRGLPEIFNEKFDVIICWGSSLPHLDSRSLTLFISGAREVLNKDGMIIIEQKNLAKLLYLRSFENVRVEGDMLTIFTEYDEIRGVQKRLVYKLPELEFLGVLEAKMWDISDVIEFVRIFFERVEVKTIEDVGRKHVIIGLRPRREISYWALKHS